MKINLDFRRLTERQRRPIIASLVTLVLGSTSVVVEAGDCPAVVVGTNNPAIDVPHVQQAVDACAKVLLQGVLNFTGMETGDPPLRVITLRRSVTVAGRRDDQGRLPQIVGGNTPFMVDAPGAVVRIQALHFVGPVSRVIRVGAANTASVTNCVIQGVVPPATGGDTVAIAVGALFESLTRLMVANNTIADPGTPIGAGIVLQPPADHPIASISITHNEIRATAHGVDLRSVAGNAAIDHNRITIANSARTGDGDTLPPQLVDGVRCMGSGACSILSNWIKTQHPNSAGVRLQATSGAVVEDNRIQMTPPPGSTSGAQSSGVQLMDEPKRNLVGRNQVSGTARTALSVSGQDNVFVLNRHQGFAPSFADAEIGEGALRTVIVDETGSISDLGTGSVVR